MKAKELKYSTSEINKNFKLKVFGIDEDGKKIDTLVGVSGLVRLIGADLANRQIERALKDGQDKCVCKLRRGLKVTYYVH